MNLNANLKPLSFSEKKELTSLWHRFKKDISDHISEGDLNRLRILLCSVEANAIAAHDEKGLPKAVMALRTAVAFSESIDADHNILIAILLLPFLNDGLTSIQEIRHDWGEDIASLIVGISDVSRFANKNNRVNQDNFRGLVISLADDIRVIIIMIVKSLVLMRSINHHPDQEWTRNVAFEANCLYAQLAHRLGLYKIKGELEDLALKYTNREIYTQIAKKLNETKRSRDAYIKQFIDPVKEKLEKAGLKFEIKGRTKSISSIWGKMQKQKIDVSGIYDLFAIRVIIDTPREKEKSDCWLAYSILADMYTANPARMKDWISIPKSNGYESLHATVMGPGSKWVEVQFRSQRMDLVAEKGLAAHWRYKGVKSDSTDQWMNNIRDILESAKGGPMQLMREMKMTSFGKEVFAFTPKGDLFRLPAGATVLDFAFMIHTNVGAKCTGANVNGSFRKLSHKIASGDTVEIVTSPTQQPRQEWLNICVSTKARNKIRQSLNEQLQIRADLGKELLQRRAKNRKLDIDESLVMKLIKKSGYKYVNEFFADIADEKIDAGRFLNIYQENLHPEETEESATSAQEFELHTDNPVIGNEPIVIGDGSVKGLNYRFAGCCNPVVGDNVFGFISSDGIIKIHRCDCPNAANIQKRYPYRITAVTWASSAKNATQQILKIVGNDDIGIVANITSLISRHTGVNLRNITVSSDDGIFQGELTLSVADNRNLTSLIKKIQGVKGVKNVERI